MNEWSQAVDSAVSSISLLFKNIVYYLKYVLLFIALPMTVGLIICALTPNYPLTKSSRHIMNIVLYGVIGAYLVYGFSVFSIIWQEYFEFGRHAAIRPTAWRAFKNMGALLLFGLVYAMIAALVYLLLRYLPLLGKTQSLLLIGLTILLYAIIIIGGVVFVLRTCLAPLLLTINSGNFPSAIRESWAFTKRRMLKLLAGLIVVDFLLAFVGFFGLLLDPLFPAFSNVLFVALKFFGFLPFIFLIHYYLRLQGRLHSSLLAQESVSSAPPV